MDIEAVLARIPYLGLHQLKVEDTGTPEVCVRMSRIDQLTNHVGIFHAGALFTQAETAAGVAAYGIVPDDRAYVLLRGATVRYTRRATGDVVAVARVEPGVAEEARAEFDLSSRTDAVVDATVTDAAGETVFQGSFDYALRPRTP